MTPLQLHDPVTRLSNSECPDSCKCWSILCGTTPDLIQSTVPIDSASAKGSWKDGSEECSAGAANEMTARGPSTCHLANCLCIPSIGSPDSSRGRRMRSGDRVPRPPYNQEVSPQLERPPCLPHYFAGHDMAASTWVGKNVMSNSSVINILSFNSDYSDDLGCNEHQSSNRHRRTWKISR